MPATRPEVKNLNYYINSAPLFVLFMHQNKATIFNEHFWKDFKKAHPGQVAMAGLDLSTVSYFNREFATFRNSWIPKIGLPRANSIYPGYYLFRNGVLIGYHSGRFDPAQINVEGDSLSTIVSAVAGAVVGIIEKNARKGVETFLAGVNSIYGLKIFEHFQQILKVKGNDGSQGKKLVGLLGTISKAYKLLGVPITATDQEVTEAWRKLVKKHHPDKAIDETQKKENNRITAEINDAYSYIKKLRKTNKEQKRE